MKSLSKVLGTIAFTAMSMVTLAVTSGTTASAATKSTDVTASQIISEAKSHLGSPYVWGATGPSAFDCSGFTGYVYKKAAKITIPRTAQAQYNALTHVTYKHIKKGDLVFFGGSKYSISHVGLYVGNGKMIDAQNRGVITEAVHAPWWHAVGYARVANLGTSTDDASANTTTTD